MAPILRNWCCPVCNDKAKPVDMHRKLKEFITLLKFICPGCSKNFQYESAIAHIKNCEAALKAIQDGRSEKVDHMAVMR